MQNQTLSTPPRAANQPTPNVRPDLATAGRPLEQAPMPGAAQTLSLDSVITTLVNASAGVSDLLFVVGRPPQVEVDGKLRAVAVEGRDVARAARGGDRAEADGGE